MIAECPPATLWQWCQAGGAGRDDDLWETRGIFGGKGAHDPLTQLVR